MILLPSASQLITDMYLRFCRKRYFKLVEDEADEGTCPSGESREMWKFRSCLHFLQHDIPEAIQEFEEEEKEKEERQKHFAAEAFKEMGQSPRLKAENAANSMKRLGSKLSVKARQKAQVLL